MLANRSFVLARFLVGDQSVAVGQAGIENVRLFEGNSTTPIYDASAKSFEHGFCVPLPDGGTLGGLISDQKNETYRVEVTLKAGTTGTLGPRFFRTIDRLSGTNFEARLDGEGSCPIADRQQFLDQKYVKNVAALSPVDAPKSLASDQVLFVAFFDSKGQQMRVKDAVVDVVKLFRGEDSEPLYSVPATSFEETTCIPIPSSGKLAKTLKDRDGALYRIQVAFKDGTSLQLKPRYIRRQNRWQAYGWDHADLVGVWIPVGLIGTNLKSTADGIEFVAAPIGVAIGGKWWLRDNFYLGLSVVGSWTIARTEAQGTGSTSTSPSTVTSAKTIGFGGLVDFGGFAYLGSMYVADLSSAHDNPGLMFLVGLGPAAIKAVADGTLRF